jgi:endonuclease/exonuclease/phosphatase (EEP) superfamily protein YafD
VRTALALAAAGLGLATGCALAARLWWAFDLFSHFRPHYAALAGLLCAAALAARAYPVALALAAVALLNGWAVRDLWLGGGTAAAAAGEGAPLRVVSANVLASNPAPGRVLDFVRGSGADLVVLVDAEGERWRGVLAALGDLYPHTAPDAWRDGAPVVLLSRWPLPVETVVHPAAAERPYVVARLAAPGATPLVVGVHPASPSPTEPEDSRERNYQLDHIGGTVEGVAGPVIVAGDLNTTPWSPHFRDLLAATGLRDAAAGRGWLPTWPAWLGPAGIPIDHVLVRGEVAVAGLRRGPDIGSDHHPLVADLRIGGHPGPRPNRVVGPDQAP